MKTVKVTVIAFVIFSFVAMPAYAATVTGTVKYDGEVPKFKEIKMDADPICLSKHSSPMFPDTLVLGPDQTMANVFVRVKSGVPKKAYPAPPIRSCLTKRGAIITPMFLA